MHVDCIKEKLEQVIRRAQRVTSKNATLPVLQCVLLEASDNQLTVRATDLDLGASFSIPVKVHEEGHVAVPGDVLGSFISHLTDENITLQTANDTLSITTANASTAINTYATDDFPTIPVIENGQRFSLKASTVVSGLRSVVMCAAGSSMKPELASVYLGVSDGADELIFVATDSFRLAEKRIPVSQIPSFEYVLIPARNVLEIIRLLEDEEGQIEIALDTNQVAFITEHMYITSRTVDGTFPDYTQIIPGAFDAEATVLKNDLLNALKMATIFSDKFHRLSISVDPSQKTIQLDTANNEVGQNSSTLEGALHGEPVSVTFNHKYVMDSFQSITSDSVSLQMNNNGKPMCITGVSDDRFTYLVMPMNT